MTVPKYYQLEAEKILAAGEKIELFTKHPGTLGGFREARLREYLSEHVPGRFAVTSGFITNHDRAGTNPIDISSRQIDCLIHDASQHAPLLRTDEFAIVTPPSVAAIVEVKSTLTLSRRFLKASESGGYKWKDKRYAWQGTLVDALENLKSAIDVMEAADVCRSTYFTGIIAYAANSLPKFAKAMTSGELFQQLGIKDIDELPDCICILDGPVWAFSLSNEEGPEEYGLGDTDPSFSYALQYPRTTKGSSLQLFTALFDNALSVEHLGQEHFLGGLRSGAGYEENPISHRIAVPCPRQHGQKCCLSDEESKKQGVICTRRRKHACTQR